MKKTNFISLVLKGFAVGGSMMIPGCSGGTMAIILGIYDQLIHAVSTFRKDLKRNAALLGTFLLGSVLGILILSKPMEYLLDNFHQPTMFFFLGAIAGSLPALFKKSGIKKIRWFDILLLAAGILIVYLLGLIPKDKLIEVESVFTVKGFILLIFSGIIIAVALVLPGISTSHMLLLLGMYDVTLKAISDLNIIFLLPLIISVLIGIFLTTSLLEKAMQKYPVVTYLLIIGFVIGSVFQIFETTGFPSGWMILYCVLTFAAGFYSILKVSKFSN